MSRGLFITLEGLDGSGKTTQIKRLARWLKDRALPFVLTRQPGGTSTGDRIRAILLDARTAHLAPMAEMALMFADRAQAISEVIEPALTQGEIVLCDRFMDSTRAYQGAMGKAEPAMIALLEKAALRDLRPDLTLVLDLPPAIGLERAARRRGAGAYLDRFEREEVAFHEGLRAAYLEIVAEEPDRCRVIDAAPGADKVAEAVWRAVSQRFLLPQEPQ